VAEGIPAEVIWDAVPGPAIEERFQALLNENAGALARMAASYTRTTGDRDDLLQDIAIALWQALPRFRGDCSERTFLFRIAQNRCLAHLARRRPVVTLDDGEMDVEDPGPTAEARLSVDQQRARLLAAVRRLPLGYRQVVTLVLEGLSYREIAQVLGIGESNVGVRLNRARQRLKSYLEHQP
jgi:RNA polymerase sigma-70 factor (ECF subfamily)